MITVDSRNHIDNEGLFNKKAVIPKPPELKLKVHTSITYWLFDPLRWCTKGKLQKLCLC